MAYSINKAFILGNVTRDPELRTTPNGQSVTSFGVATNRRWKDASGAMQEETQFHDVVVWGKLAEAISQILRKGTKVAVIGRLQTRGWEAPDGSKRTRTEIIMEDFVPLSPKGTGTSDEFEPTQEPTSSETDQAPPKTTVKSNSKKTPNPTNDDEINLDDIPF